MAQKKTTHIQLHWALLAVLAVALNACGFVTAPAQHAVARSAQLGVKTYDKGVEKGEEAAIMVRDTAVITAHVAADASVKTVKVASNTSDKVLTAAKNTSILALEKVKKLPSNIKSAVVNPDYQAATGATD
jgi:hypothetical protein